MGEYKYIYLGAFLILVGGWQTLFEKDERYGILFGLSFQMLLRGMDFVWTL